MSDTIRVTLSSRFLLIGMDMFCATCLNMFVTVARLVLDRSSVLFASDNTMFSAINELSTLSADNPICSTKSKCVSMQQVIICNFATDIYWNILSIDRN